MKANIKFKTIKKVRNILVISFAIFLLGLIFYNPIQQKASNNSETAPSYELSFKMETLKMIAGESVKVDIDITRNGFEEPITLKTENLPDGFNVEFEENPVEGDVATAWIYSPVNVLQCENPIVIDSEEDPEPSAKIRLMVNCGIDWVQQFDSGSGDALQLNKVSDDRQNAVTTDENGNIYVTGNTFGTFDSNNPHQGDSDVWVAKYDNTGNQEWISQIGSEGEDRVSEIAVDTEGNVFIGGYTSGAMPDNSHVGNFDFWIAKYNNSGEREWVEQGGTNGQDGKYGFEIIPDNQGGVKIATLEFERQQIKVYEYGSGGGNGSNTLIANVPQTAQPSPYDLALTENGELFLVGKFNDNGLDKAYVLKFDASGNFVWDKQLSEGFNREATRVVVDSNEDVYVSGNDFPTSSNVNAWVAKLDGSTNALIWLEKEQSYSNSADDLIKTIGINPDGDVVIAGYTESILGERRGSGEDAWVSRRDANTGELKWINQFPISSDTSFEAVAFDNNNGIILAGRTQRWLNVGNSTDALLLRFDESINNPYLPTISDVTIETYNGQKYLRVTGTNLQGTTSVRINGVPYGLVIKSSSKLETDYLPQNLTGDAKVSVSASCITLTRDITIN